MGRRLLRIVSLNIWMILILSGNIFAQESNIIIGKSYKINSRFLKEERQYLVHLPASYESDKFYIQKKYPVLYLLDGDTHFHLVSGLVSSMSAEGNEKIPEMIVVAITNTDRTRDLTPYKANLQKGSAAFLQFLQEELVPQIDNNYRTLPYRILAGHSLGGLFAVEIFLKQSKFNSFLALDPSLWWDNAALVHTSETALQYKRSFPTSLFIAQANNPFNEGLVTDAKGKAIQSFIEKLKINKSEKVAYKHIFYSQEDHFSVPLLSLYEGLSFVFEGYKFPLNKLKSYYGADIRNHYKDLSKKWGVPILPPGKLLNQVGLFVLNNEKMYDKAIEIFKLNQEYYPNTYITYNSLGEAYKRKGDTALAIYNYKKSLQLNVQNENARKALMELDNLKSPGKAATKAN